MKKLLMRGNSTMPKTVGIFNLPAEITCTPSPWCQEHCYAKKNRFCWANVRRGYYERLEESHWDCFKDRMICEIKCYRKGKVIGQLGGRDIVDRKEHPLPYVLVHISGDFYSREYVKKWGHIAAALPNTIFRTNTRRRDLMPLMKSYFPSNFVVRESTDPTRRHLGFFPQAAIPGTPGSEDFFECCNDCAKCKFRCWHEPELNVRIGKVL